MSTHLVDLTNRNELDRWLDKWQLSGEEAQRKSRFLQTAVAALRKCGDLDHKRAYVCFVPGRIEVLGKHTDYAGGRSLVCAAERGFCAVGVARDDQTVSLTDVRQGETIQFPLAPDVVPKLGHWSNYPMTVGRRVSRNFPGTQQGVEIAFASDLPPAAGMSSSSALVVMTFGLLGRVNNLGKHAAYQANIHDDLQLGEYLGTIENGQSYGTLVGDRGVGTFGGSEDHTAILCSRAGKLGQFAYCPVRHERWVELAKEFVFVIAVSGVVAEKTGAAMQLYNRAARRAAAVAELWRETTGRDEPHLAAILAAVPNAVTRVHEMLASCRHAEFSAQELIDRFDQFVAESNEIIPAVGNRLAAEEVTAFGRLAHRSQRLGAEQLGNQVPETVWLASAAERLGAEAASAFGAGFGGSVWALVAAREARQFMARLRTEYVREFPHHADRMQFFATRPGPSASFSD